MRQLPHESLGEKLVIDHPIAAGVVRELGGMQVLLHGTERVTSTMHFSTSERQHPCQSSVDSAQRALDLILADVELPGDFITTRGLLLDKIETTVLRYDWWERFRIGVKEGVPFTVGDFYKPPKEVIVATMPTHPDIEVTVYNFGGARYTDEEMAALIDNLNSMMQQLDLSKKNKAALLAVRTDRIYLGKVGEFNIIDEDLLYLADGSKYAKEMASVLFCNLLAGGRSQIVPELDIQRLDFSGQWGMPVVEAIEIS